MAVLLCSELSLNTLTQLFQPYGLVIQSVADGEDLPGSFWQPPEAGLIGDTLYIRNDTPVHSALHEACHYICMDQARREQLDTNAGGGYEEEDGVCYLQILLADSIPQMGRERMFSDMDAWGYSFRLGAAQAWFEADAEDAVAWLQHHNIIDEQQAMTFSLRQ